MTSVLDLARCCKAVYQKDPKVAGWHRERVYNPPDTGFYAALFTQQNRHGSGGLEAILAIRGTHWSNHFDGVTNLMLAMGITPFQYRQARLALIDALELLELPVDNFFVTGHSQGGGLAALAAARNPRPVQVVTFNAPGMFRAAVNSLLGLTVLWRLRGHGSLKSYYAEFDRALHLRSEYDLVSLAVGPQISGNTRTLKNTLCARLKPRHWWLPPRAIGRYLRRANCAHRMATMVKLVSGIDRYRQPVRWV